MTEKRGPKIPQHRIEKEFPNAVEALINGKIDPEKLAHAAGLTKKQRSELFEYLDQGSIHAVGDALGVSGENVRRGVRNALTKVERTLLILDTKDED